MSAAQKNYMTGIDRLQEYIDQDAYILLQDGEYWLFDKNGEGIVSGANLRRLLINLMRID